MARKGDKQAGKGPPPISTLPPAAAPAPPKRPRKKASDPAIPKGSLPPRKRKLPAAEPDRFADWDPVKVAAECKAAVLEKARAARGTIVIPEGAMHIPGEKAKRAPKAKAPVKSATAPAEKAKVEPKPDVPMTDALFVAICLEIAAGVPLRQVCRRADMPGKSMFYTYLDGEDVEDDVARAQVVSGRIARYARARKLGYDDIAEEALEIADDGSNDWMERELEGGLVVETLNGEHVQRSKLRVDTRLKLLAKWDPKGYGDALKLGDFDGKPLNKDGRSVSDLAIDIAKLMVAATREVGGDPSAEA